MEAAAARWGTWEELVLGGAVIRHGAGAWDAVAAEIQARTPFPRLFSPEVCEAKFMEIQERYSGCDAWFEELRKQRVAELKRELEKSEHSIGSLQSKLESLSSGRSSETNFDSDSSRVEPAGTAESAGNIDTSSHDLSKERSSAGSFTEDPSCQIKASVSVDSEEKAHREGLENWGWSCRKKRGKRGGRSFLTAMVTSKDSGSLDSAAVNVEREASSKARLQGCSPCCEESGASLKSESTTDMDLAKVLASVLKNRDFSMFQHQLNSQRKRARYRKAIRQHTDFDTIRAKISDGSISSAKELLRDLLLLANNSLVFYPKNSLEHESALAIRHLAGKALLDHTCPCPAASPGNSGSSSSSFPAGKSKKARTMQRPCDRSTYRTDELSAGAGGQGLGRTENRSGVDAGDVRPASRGGSAVKKKRGVGRPPKGGQRRGRTQLEEGSSKGRKRARG